MNYDFINNFLGDLSAEYGGLYKQENLVTLMLK